MNQRPGDGLPALSGHKTPRVVAARRLTSRSGRTEAGRFLAEGAQAVREALAYGTVHELFATEAAADKHPELVARAAESGARISSITQRAAEMLSETVSPQGLVAVCELVDVPLADALSGSPRLVAVLAGIADPGNAGTVLRVADAAGADAVIFAGDTVDPHNGKCVRASTGSLFHLPVARERDVAKAIEACRAAGLRVFAADGYAEAGLESADDLAAPSAWVLGNEAHGLSADLLALADRGIRVPIYGKAESLNLATAASLCLYASAMAAHR
ncbi:TrmH family RNA methyltransferase [Amycolatopsis magusensis]|uniref:TrmH family RNA methyltransferase n=1 Tax=Amycolatopsis magusensis TaxID=882444 RepID=A0ABS4PSF6_9PSEU|nr:RNA methyltransferase [Amycolatopsis magusensis]MBP2182352.1 TrmH family RNA methyltransferase [Amycolatopsis magusensis]MDI5976343.1 RNA methyltransferase [Amycolatopsis magusensis]